MIQLTVSLAESDYQRLEKATKRAGKSVQLLVHEWITQLPEVEEPFDVTSDPVYLMEGYESDAPADLSVNLDQYIYGEFAEEDRLLAEEGIRDYTFGLSKEDQH